MKADSLPVSFQKMGNADKTSVHTPHQLFSLFQKHEKSAGFQKIKEQMIR